MTSPGTVRPVVGGRLVSYLGSNCTVDDLLASSTDATSGTIILVGPQIAMLTSSTGAVMTRNALGDYSWNRTAGGAETHYAVGQVLLGQSITASKGFKITGGFVSYALGVADATSVDVTINRISYSQAVANAVITHGGTLTYDAAHNTAALRKAFAVTPHRLTFTLGTPVYHVTRASAVTIEAAFVLANTGTLAVQAIGFDYTFNYNGA